MAYKIKSHGKQRWRGKRQVNGVQYQGNFETKGEAEAWEAEVRRNGPQTKTNGRILTVSEWIDANLDDAKSHGRASTTIKERIYAFKGLLACVAFSTPVTEIDVKLATKILTRRMELSGTKASNKDKKNLAAAWKWGVTHLDFPEKNPFKLAESFAEAAPERRVPKEEDFWKVFDAADTLQDQTLLMAYLHTGARKSELLKLRWADVDLAGKCIRLYTKKRKGGGLAHDTIPLTAELRDQLEAHRKSLGFFAEHVFLRPQTLKPYTARIHMMKYLCEKAGVDHFGFHALRHLTASVLYKQGYPLNVIQKILRHKSANTTARYIHDLIGIDVDLDSAFTRPSGTAGNGKSKTPEALCFEGLTGSADGFRNAVPE